MISKTANLNFYQKITHKGPHPRAFAILPYVVFTSLFAVTSFFTAQLKTSQQLKAQQLGFLKPLPYQHHFAFGFGETIADSMWIRAIQDFDRCGQKAHEETTNDLRKKGLEVPICQGSWVFTMIDVITTLAPKFYMAHSAGANMLSISVNDPKGAAQIFERGVRRFPSEWSLAYRAGYHYMFELNEPIRAAELFKVAADKGAPEFLNFLAARLYSKQGQGQLALAVLKDYSSSKPEVAETPRYKELLKKAQSLLQEGQASAESERKRFPSAK